MYLGIDMGGTKIAAGLVKNGVVTKRMQLPTGAEKGKKFVLGQLQKVLETYEEETIEGIGIGIPGLYKGTKIVNLPHVPCLNGVDLKKFSQNIIVQNDARCFALAEHAYGAGKKA